MPNKQISKSPNNLLTEYKPAILFLARFLGVYIIGNILYGLYIVSFDIADPVTQLVSDHTVGLLRLFGQDVTSLLAINRPTTILQLEGMGVIEVYEGCNAINVSILFVAFQIAYKGSLKNTIVFSIFGLISIYIFNLLRLAGLFYVALYFPDQMFLMHKFVFTGVIYAFIFGLWYLWVTKFSKS